MTDTSIIFGGAAPGNDTAIVSIAGVTFPIGTPVVASTTVAETVVPGRANAVGTTYVIGVAASSGVIGNKTFVQYSGPLTLTTLEWDAITGQTGGLTLDVPYYLSSATAGKLTATAPSAGGTFKQPVGVALSHTTMMIELTFPVAN
jgi:hypothetical protein